MTIRLPIRCKATIKFSLCALLYLMLICCTDQTLHGKQVTLKFSGFPDAALPNLNYVKYELSTTDLLPTSKDLQIWFFFEEESRRRKQLISTMSITLKAGEVTTKGDIFFPSAFTTGDIGFSLSPTGGTSDSTIYWKTIYSGHQRAGLFNAGDRFPTNEVKFSFDPNDLTSIKRGKNRNGGGASLPSDNIKLDQLPNHWLGYSGQAFGVITADDLIRLAQNNPQRFEALEKWLRLGGRLQVRESGDDFEKLAKVLKSFGITNRTQFSNLDFYASDPELRLNTEFFGESFGSGSRSNPNPVELGASKLHFDFSRPRKSPKLSPDYKNGKWKFNLNSKDPAEPTPKILNRLSSNRSKSECRGSAAK